MNEVLLRSSVVCAILHCFVIVVARPAFSVEWLPVVAGIATSIWNHGTISATARRADRLVIGMIVLTRLMMPGQRAVVACGAGAYLLAKRTPDRSLSNALHIASHVFGSISNLMITVIAIN